MRRLSTRTTLSMDGTLQPGCAVQREARSLYTRAVTFSPRTLNVEERSAEAILATEHVALVYDWKLDEELDETLTMRGVSIPDYVPLLDNHAAYSNGAVLGHWRNLRVDDNELVGRFYFAETGDDEEGRRVESLWNRIRDGHQRGVSAGYAVEEGVILERGESRVIEGKRFTAGSQRRLRVATRWTVREGSIVPMGADDRTGIRSGGPSGMNPELRLYLESLRLRSGATDAEAQEFYRNLQGNQRAIADSLMTRSAAGGAQCPPGNGSGDGSSTSTGQPANTQQAATVTAADGAHAQRAAAPQNQGQNRSQTQAAAQTQQQTAQATQQRAAGDVVMATVAQDPPDQRTAVAAEPLRRLPDEFEAGRRAEVQRQADLRSLFGTDEPELLTRAIDDGWSVEQARGPLLDAIRRGRAQVDGAGPGIHSRSTERDQTRGAIEGGLLLRTGVALDNEAYQSPAAVNRLPEWMRRNINDDVRQRNMELAHRYSDMSLVDICRAALQLEGVSSIPHGREELIQRAVSSSALSAIFTTNVNAQLLMGYTDQADSTNGWVRESDVPDFRSNERATMGKMGALKKHARGGTAEDMDTSDSKEEFKIARYSGKFTIDEQDIIDDRFGSLDSESPMEMGQSARQLRPDLIYAILLANANLQDGIALFEAVTHKNLNTGGGSALSAGSLQTALAQMGTQRIRNRPINVRAAFLLCPHQLGFTADIILRSAERRESATSDGTRNPLQNYSIDVRPDDRLNTAGVIDPDTETQYAGSETNWFLIARPGENGAKTIEVAYLRGSGRAPQTRSYNLTQGQWGIGWDIKLDIGAKALDFRAMQKNDGA